MLKTHLVGSDWHIRVLVRKYHPRLLRQTPRPIVPQTEFHIGHLSPSRFSDLEKFSSARQSILILENQIWLEQASKEALKQSEENWIVPCLSTCRMYCVRSLWLFEWPYPARRRFEPVLTRKLCHTTPCLAPNPKTKNRTSSKIESCADEPDNHRLFAP